MRIRKHQGQSIAQLRKIIGKSQSQFAAMIGVSKHTIISVENGRNQLSEKLKRRIYEATGADLDSNSPNDRAQIEHYDIERFRRWRQGFHETSEKSARKQFDEMKTWLRVIFLAAGKSGRAGNRDRLPALRLSLIEWMEEARKNFKLDHQIDELLPEESRHINRSALVISSLLKDPIKAEANLAEHDISFKKLKPQLQPYAQNGLLIVEDEFAHTWGPLGFDIYVAKPRRLIPAARCWIRMVDPNKSGFTQLYDSLRPHEAEPLLAYSTPTKSAA